MTKLLTVAEMMCRDLARRRTALGLLALVPLTFYLARHTDQPEKAIRFAGLGLAWAVSTAALFTSNTTKAVESRLRQTGFRVFHLYVGTLLALLSLGAVLGGAYWGLIVLDQDLDRPLAVGLEFGLTVLVAAPLGLLISALAPRDLEGTLILITLTGLQFLVDPAEELAKLLPFWSTREVGIYGVEMGAVDHLRDGVVHAAIYVGVLLAATAGMAAYRLRRRSHIRLQAAGA
ncbi:hypothetical protein GCM10010123_40560 [Pilimelia anulata]|uniref:Uncharacterized protein n=1 Tax=Pilimelia anulata TaxID=53371 RepID=A0A8J3BA64_9ACTN|nr:hypothetical protein [Pilimelia anulata]GGK06671.1 hypothetical protein GCM10010123_40560 [Pilimelia anulata]